MADKVVETIAVSITADTKPIEKEIKDAVNTAETKLKTLETPHHLTVNTDKATHAIGGLGGAASGLMKPLSGVLDMFGKIGLAGMGLSTIVGVFEGIGQAAMGFLDPAIKFEETMSGIKAVSGATAEQMDQLSKLSLQLGKDTVFSAAEAAVGIEELIKGGLSIEDIMNGAAKATLNLATAGGVDLKDAAEIAANAMAMFNLKGEDLAKVADQIAGAANASSLSVTDFRYSLQMVGAVANLAGQDFDDTATAIALLGKMGLKGADAGTSLKTMLMNLQPTTKAQTEAMHALGLMTAEGTSKFVDANGKYKSLAEISGLLNEATKDLSESEKTMRLEMIFGSDAIRAAAILSDQGAAGFDSMAAAMGKVTAESVAAERLNNFAGAMKQFEGSLETAKISLGLAFLPMLKILVDLFTTGLNMALPFIDMFSVWVKGALKDAGAWLKIAGDKLGIVFDLFKQGKAGGPLQAFFDAFKSGSPLLKAASDYLKTLGDILTGVFDVISGKKDFGTWITESIGSFVKAWANYQNTLSKLIGDVLMMIGTEVGKWAGEFVKWLVPAYTKFMKEWPKTLDNILNAIGDAVPLIIEAVLGWARAFTEWLVPMLPTLLLALGAVYGAIVIWIAETALVIAAKLLEWAWEFVQWVVPATWEMLKALAGLLIELGKWIKDVAIPYIEKEGPKWIDAFTKWIDETWPKMQKKLEQLWKDFQYWIMMDIAPKLANQLGDWRDAFMAWVGPASMAMLEKLGQLLLDLGGWMLTVALPWIVMHLLEWSGAFIQWIVPLIPVILGKLLELVVAIGTWIVTVGLPWLIIHLWEWGNAFADWVGPASIKLGLALTKLLNKLSKWIENDALPEIKIKLFLWGRAFAEWAEKAADDMIIQLGILLIRLSNWIMGEALPAIIAQLAMWAWAFVQWVYDAQANLTGALWSLGGMILGWIADLDAQIKNYLWDIVLGFMALPGQILGALGGLFNAGVKLGAAIRNGLIEGLNNVLIEGLDLAGQLIQLFKNLINGAIQAINDAIPDKIDFILPWPFPPYTIYLPANPLPPAMANGALNFAGGLAMVGEQGPELVTLPRGSNVYSNNLTTQLMGLLESLRGNNLGGIQSNSFNPSSAGLGGTVNNYYQQTVNTRATTPTVVQDFWQLKAMVGAT